MFGFEYGFGEGDVISGKGNNDGSKDRSENWGRAWVIGLKKWTELTETDDPEYTQGRHGWFEGVVVEYVWEEKRKIVGTNNTSVPDPIWTDIGLLLYRPLASWQ
jgi:hypothetical protein